LFVNASRVFHHDGHSSYLAFRLFLDVFRLCSAAGSCLERHWNISGIIFIPASVYHLTVASLRLYDRYKRHVWLSLGGFRAVSNHRFLRRHICFRRPSVRVGLLSDLQLDGQAALYELNLAATSSLELSAVLDIARGAAGSLSNSMNSYDGNVAWQARTNYAESLAAA
jgi:hypothetical protein